MTPRSTKRIVLAFALSIAFACASVAVRTEAPSGKSPAAFATFVQAPPPDASPDLPRYDAALGARIQQEIASELGAKGYRAADAADADLKVGFTVGGRPGTKLVNAGDPDVDYYEERPYVAGTLTIEIVDAHTNELVWQGVGETDLFTGGALIESDVERAALRTARDILAKLPASGSKP